MKRALAGGFTAMILLGVPAIFGDEPSKTATKGAAAAGGNNGNPSWSFKLTPNSGPLLAEPSGSADPVKAAPLFTIQLDTKLQRKGQGEPTSIELPRVWWTGDYLTPLEQSRRVIPRSDRVRE